MSVYRFGRFKLPFFQIFFESKHCYGVVNLKPVVSGHVLVVARRPVPRYVDLPPEEVADLMVCSQIIGRAIELEFSRSSLNFVIQDGKGSGQTIPQVHVRYSRYPPRPAWLDC